MNVLLIYASRRGVTRKMADVIKEQLELKNHQVFMKKAKEMQADDLLEYPAIVLGSSTWADGDLHEDIDQLERDLRDKDLKGIKAAVFGSGNSRFRYFCEAVDILETRMKHSGATLLLPSLKADIMEKKMDQVAEEWGKELSEKL